MELVLELTKDVTSTVENAKNLITSNGGMFDGDIVSGEFSINKIKGMYFVYQQFVTITITDKPFYVLNSVIKQKLKNILYSLNCG